MAGTDFRHWRNAFNKAATDIVERLYVSAYAFIPLIGGAAPVKLALEGIAIHLAVTLYLFIRHSQNPHNFASIQLDRLVACVSINE